MIITNIEYESDRIYVIGDTDAFSISYDGIGIYPYSLYLYNTKRCNNSIKGRAFVIKTGICVKGKDVLFVLPWGVENAYLFATDIVGTFAGALLDLSDDKTISESPKVFNDMPYLIVKSSAALKFRWTGTRSAGAGCCHKGGDRAEEWDIKKLIPFFRWSKYD